MILYARTIEVNNPTGLHTRPGTRFVKEARRFSATVSVSKGEKTADAKNLIKVLKIGISKGDVIEIQADGSDETEAVDGLCAFISALED